MTVCPHCGRNLVPAGPRWALWIPLGLLLAFAAYWGYDQLPVEQMKQEAAAAQAQLSGLVQLPELASPTPTQNIPTVRPSPPPTRTPTTTPTRPPTATPSLTPTATATGGVREYTVQSGDSLALIGQKLDLPWQTIATLNGLTAYSMLQPGDKLKLPTLTPAPTRPAATGTPTVTNTVAAATVTPGRDANPTLIVTGTPTTGATVTPIAARTREATATARASTATPIPPPTPTPAPTNTPAPLLATLVLVNPGDGSSYESNNAQLELQWQNKDYLPVGAVYRVTFQWINKGAPMIHHQDTTATSIRAPLWLWGEADQPARQYFWSVQIVQLTTDGKGGERVIPLNPPSEKRTFYWK